MVVIERPTEKLTLHRMEVLEKALTKIPITDEEMGIIYRYSVVQRDRTSVWIRGLSTEKCMKMTEPTGK